MASSSGPSLNEELQCSICMQVFTDPVTTACGHNFCRTCLSECWTNTQTCFCPLCKEKFSKRPKLNINSTLREVVQHFKEKPNLEESEVFCDFCSERKQKAVKTCLTCQSSYCDSHLKPHRSVECLKKHTLINAVENLEDYICQKHERPLELFCRDDQTCVCLSCTEGEHRTHNTVPIEEESREKKARLVQTQTDVHQMIQDRKKKIQEIQHSVELRKRNTEEEKSSSVELFTDLIRSIKRSQSDLMKMTEKQQKAAEKQAEDLIKEIHQEITELKRRNTELEQLSHTDDHLHLIQMSSSLYTRPHAKNWTEIRIDSDVNVNSLFIALIQLKKTLDETLDEEISQTGLKFVQKFAVDVTLDPDTADPYLILSDDGKQVSYGDIEQDVPENPKRFDVGCCVLAKQGFSSGRFYYEVQVKGKTVWDLGVVRESINRQEEDITLSPEDGVWIVTQSDENEYYACESPSVSLSLRVKPEKVGVFVDYEEGLVSFYDVKSRSHIYSFTGQTFTEKLYPYFSPWFTDNGKKSNPLIITPVSLLMD
ncbi:E3 ubiquitin-protein ligase TRIM39-like isoform X2 [Rhinichthys klamathensis goyatoka]|uniref:E3 ubiquitin-protein ligase TRIM39-like isoform X2 n=1 Tax=Rhinichthys klamathensis goyatoka TaxID=3034132 RepID=UPI0024B4D217|nr:E3 ubiquitin-protein ligase TRIM39-like isoform X2 [Rhinichthys klamathensis goyatoka]